MIRHLTEKAAESVGYPTKVKFVVRKKKEMEKQNERMERKWKNWNARRGNNGIRKF